MSEGELSGVKQSSNPAVTQRDEQALAEQKRLFEQQLQERTVELRRANAALREEVAAGRRYAERLRSMREIDKAILGAQLPQNVAEAVLRRLYPLLPCEHVSVVALDSDTNYATILASMDDGQYSNSQCLELSGEQLEELQVLRSGKRHRFNDVPNLLTKGDRVWSLIIDIPLFAEETLVGVLNLATNNPSAFTREHDEIVEEVAIQLAMAIRQARLFAEISSGRERLRALSLRLVEVQETERRFIAHELHDEIGQVLTGLKLTLELPGREMPELPDANTKAAISMVDDLMSRVRQLSLDLRPHVLDDLGLMPALEWLFRRYLTQTGIHIDFKHSPVRGRMPAHLETAAFRIVQEALTNIARHARVQQATVRLWLDEGRLGVQIQDQGVGFDGEQALSGLASSGVAGMRERALVLGGDFTLETKPGHGTRLTVELPSSGSVPSSNLNKGRSA